MALQDKLLNNQASLSAPQKTDDVALSKAEAQAALRNSLDAIEELRKQSASHPEVDLSKYDELEQRARDLYNQRADRNQWLDVAQTIGNSLIKLGMAQQGLRKGVDLSRASDPNLVHDFSKDTDRAFGDYKTDLATALEKRSQAIRAGEIGRREELDAAEKKPRQLGEVYKQKEDTYQQMLRQRDMLDRSAAQEERQAQRERDRQAAAEKKELEKEKTAEIKRLSDLIDDNQKQLSAANELVGQYNNYNNLNKRAKQQVDVKLGQLAGKAGIPSEVLNTIGEKSKEGTGIFGMFQSENPKAKAELVSSEVVDPLKQKLEELQEQRRQLTQSSGTMKAMPPSGSASGETQPASSTAAKSAGKKMTRAQLSEYAQKNFGGNEAAARKFLEDKGYGIE